ncbi:hypothetical protein VMF7928_04128 [Vibrio marisflavi CECT 7928]|uniref:Lipoprotein n=1 Tax=Vibrio marisflavi CECT 7928 TaxID=634439 RepID=A0ABM9A9C5_9VIBR|nr:hypothetical protein VMF7928_04128 [Vibrio marisflavi CECT 7928]
MKKTLIALTVMSALALAGCGQTGPLYMPKDNTTNSEAQSATPDSGSQSTAPSVQTGTQSEQHA